MTSRRAFLKSGASAAAAATLTRGIRANTFSRTADKKNVLFITIDDLRPQLGCYGHQFMHSPNIDALSSDGITFLRSYCQVPVCGASRASFLSGLRPTDNRFTSYKTRVDDDAPGIPTLPGIFKENGYRSTAFGKFFHHSDDGVGGLSEAPYRTEKGGRYYALPENREIAAKSSQGHGPAYENADVDDKEYADGVLARKCIEEMQYCKENNLNFFVGAGFRKPHLPFNAPKRYWDMYSRDEIDLADNPFAPKGAPGKALHNWNELRAYYGIPGSGALDENLARTLIHGYYACVSFADAQVGRLIEELKRLEVWNNTVIVLLGDHGWQLGEHGLWCKHANFETSLRAPLILRDPDSSHGIQTDALTEFVDVYPTLCRFCDIPVPSHCEGVELTEPMRSPAQAWKEAVFSRYQGGESVKTDGFRYTEWSSSKKMLYDHQIDPNENVNVVDDEQYRGIVENMQKLLVDGWRSVRPVPTGSRRFRRRQPKAGAKHSRMDSGMKDVLGRRTRASNLGSGIEIGKARKRVRMP